eukprot:scaffold26257_cov100-Isochrysis_galbana.AAC.3
MLCDIIYATGIAVTPRLKYEVPPVAPSPAGRPCSANSPPPTRPHDAQIALGTHGSRRRRGEIPQARGQHFENNGRHTKHNGHREFIAWLILTRRPSRSRSPCPPCCGEQNQPRLPRARPCQGARCRGEAVRVVRECHVNPETSTECERFVPALPPIRVEPARAPQFSAEAGADGQSRVAPDRRLEVAGEGRAQGARKQVPLLGARVGYKPTARIPTAAGALVV